MSPSPFCTRTGDLGVTLSWWGGGSGRCRQCCGRGAGQPGSAAPHQSQSTNSAVHFLNDVQNIMVLSFRLTSLRREQRCFPKVWTTSYPPCPTWFRGNAAPRGLGAFAFCQISLCGGGWGRGGGLLAAEGPLLLLATP